MAEEDLRIYYNYLYPFKTLVNWLTQNNKSQLAHRELSFEYEGVGVERYVTFVDANAMKNRMIDRNSKIPLKVDAGAIWNRTPEKDSNGKTLER
jgi:DNA primase catalytic subunit